MVAMVEPSGTEQREPTGWAFVRMMVREFVHEWRHPTPFPVRYLRCDDGCGRVTPHSSIQRIYTLRVAEREVAAPPAEAVCDECRHAQPRTVGDEITADVTVTCTGHPFRRFGSKRSRRTCGQQFAVPGTASSVLCPWRATSQPNPAPPPPANR